jgi:hypothetical protein
MEGRARNRREGGRTRGGEKGERTRERKERQ